MCVGAYVCVYDWLITCVCMHVCAHACVGVWMVGWMDASM